MRRALYAGTFDPPTEGHRWMIEQAASMFDELFVTIGVNPAKHTMFSVEERKAMLREMTRGLPNVSVTTISDEFLVEYAKSENIGTIIRGIRTSEDYEYERTMRNVNGDFAPNIVTIFLMPPRELSEVSSSMVKSLIGPRNWKRFVYRFVPDAVMKTILSQHLTLWKNLKQIGAKGDEQKFWSTVLTPYFEAGRFYHNWLHPCDLMDEFETIRRKLYDSNAVELAIWFHDIFYDAARTDNEERSAELAYTTILALEFPGNFAEKVRHYILATKSHTNDHFDSDLDYFLDMDLSILGKPPEIFDAYEENVRLEYVGSGACTEEEFRIGRPAFLKKFLETRENGLIYRTLHFRQRYEEQALANIKRSLAEK